MEAHEIVANLKNTPYKFNYANRVRTEVKSLNDDDSDFIMLELKRAMEQPDNYDIAAPIAVILN